MEFRLLGPVELWSEGTRVELGHARQRCVLAVLLMEARRAVPVETLIDRVWGHEPPDAALSVVYGYVARLRKILRPHGVAVERTSSGYVLCVEPEAVDAHRFRELLRTAAIVGPRAASALLDEALSLCRGVPLSNLSGAWAQGLRRTLQEQELKAVIDRNEMRIRQGRYAELVPGLVELVTAHPLDERPVAQLMRSLYHLGRSGEALDYFRLARERLADRIGLSPTPMLTDLQWRILSGGEMAPSGAGDEAA